MPITANVTNEQITATVGETQIDVSVSGGVGPSGSSGTAATIAVGTVTTGAAGSQASVTNVGTSSAAVFDFSIPAGATGATGPQGATGATGPAGVVAATAPLTYDANTQTVALPTNADIVAASITVTDVILGMYSAIAATAGFQIKTATNASTPYFAINTSGHVTTGEWRGTAVAVAYGGTGATDAGTARTNLGAAAASHTHSASDVSAGSTAGLVIVTTTGGALSALSQGTAGQVLKVNSGATGVEWGAAAADVSIDTTAADVLSASSGSITADDPGADRIVFWDDSASKLTHLTVGSGLSISGTTITAAVTPTVASPSQITANQNDYAGATADINRISSDAARNITGIAAGTDGQSLLLINVGSNTITLKHQSTSSTAANRIIVPWGNDYAIPADGSATLVYDNTTARWRVL